MATKPVFPVVDPEDLEELRLALVMNGGVSLAVWMGGVANEIDRLVRKEGAYGELLAATGTVARVDVISGTSAGGINGALLALANVYDASLAPLRDLWLTQGALEDLLRTPVEADPPSLLRGDDYFLVEMRRAFAELKRRGQERPKPADAAPMDLTLTTTLLHGFPNQIPDDFGTVIADVDHRAQFRFRRGPDLARDSFNDERIDERLAFAARATACFPVAFEPVHYPAQNPEAVGAPKVEDTRNLRKDRFLLDGGILDNKPLESAVEAVFAQRAEGDVRRILAYVVPDPGISASDAADDPAAMPGIGQVALASLMELPRVESVSAQIAAVARHNKLVRRKHENRAGIMILGPATLTEIAGRLFPVYRRRRLESSASYFLPEVSAGLVALTKGKLALGRRLRDWMLGRFLEVADAVPWVPQTDPLGVGAQHHRAQWSWGVFALENMADTMLDVLRRTLRLTRPSAEHRAIRGELIGLRRRAFDLFRQVRERRADEAGFWRKRGETLANVLASGGTASLNGDAVRKWTVEALRSWSERFMSDGPASLGALGAQMAQLILENAALFRAAFPDARSWIRGEDRAGYGSLREHFDVLAPPGSDVDGVLRNLLVVEVVLNAFGSYRDVRDQYVEMVQISADAPTSFASFNGAREKLAGAQLANFGAFVKRSWRASDWMFGRLDGAERLSRILVNPDRLRRLYGVYTDAHAQHGRASALEAVHCLAVSNVSNRADRVFLEQLWRRDLDRMQGELAFIDDPDIPVPEQLPFCAGAIARRLHLDVLREELPVVANAVEHDLERGGKPRGHGDQFALAMDQAVRAAAGKRLAPQMVVELFAKCKVGRERIEDEVGSDLATSLASRAVAVTVAAGAGKHSKLGPVTKLFKAGRIPAIAFDFFAQGLVARSRTMVAVFTAAFVLGAGLLLVGVTYADKMPGVLRSAGAVLLVGALAVAFLRYHVLAFIATLVGGALMIVAIGPDWLSPRSGEDAGAWLKVAAVVLFLALACVLAYIVAHGPRQGFVWTGRRKRPVY